MPTETLMMKDSKIGSIKDIPINWEIKKTKYLFDVVNGSTPDSDYYDYWDGDINWITPADMVDFGYVSMGERSITKKGYKSCGTTLVPSNTIVISTRAPIGKINITKSELCTNQGCKCLVSEKLCNKYFYYLLYSQKEQLIDAGRGTTFIELSTFSLSNFSLILPPLPEQQTIADFLDKKCEKIDKVIGEIEEQIQVLEDYKKSLITETVTKGLDKNVPMKDSGIDYLGKISAHYKITKLKYLLSGITDGTHGTFDRFAEGEYLLSAKNVFEDGLHIEENESLISERDYREIVKNGFPRKGDVLVCCVGTIGRTCVYSLDKPLAFQRSVVFLRPNKKVKSKYLQYLMQAESSQIQMQLFANASAQAGIYMGTLQTIIVIEVPIAEQEQIADYLDKECTKIDKTINDKKEQLETIKEYKKSLIYEYVTGKKRVAC